MVFKLIPLKNKHGNIIAHTKVSEGDYEHLCKFAWWKHINGYVQAKKNGKHIRLHRYIKEYLEGIDITNHIIDHINSDPLDNTRENLRLSNPSNNSRNSKKKDGTTSKYKGVSKQQERWRTYMRINDTALYASFKKEEHAAHQYNLWLKEYNVDGKINDIKESDIKDFVPYVKPTRKKTLPKGIVKNKDGYTVIIYGKRRGNYATIEEAKKVAKQVYKEIDEQKKLQPKNEIIKDGNTLIIKTNNGTEIKADVSDYDKLKSIHWRINSNGYAIGTHNKKNVSMSRFIMDYIGRLIVDHINGDRLDNRRSNLRIVTHTQNSLNRSSHKGSSSQYIGVSYYNRLKKWVSRATINGKEVHLGSFDTELEAAQVRETKIKELSPYSRLNNV